MIEDTAGGPTPQRKVVVTGAGGAIGATIVEHLSTRWDVIATDIRGTDLLEALDALDGPACRQVFAGADSVIHLAATPDPNATWDELLPKNVIAVHEVAAATMAVGVPRLVLASSMQAVTAYPLDQQVRAEDPPRPANLYGATKGWAESIGSWVAATSSTTVVALRIGFFGAEPPSGIEATPRNLAAWISPRDCAELVRAAVEGPVDGFTVASGVSANRYRKAAYGAAEVALGYRPVDDAWDPAHQHG
ncbi:MAG: NAD-dependent epimerase/dehydratase family protein [Acidimicrobiales bacterium]